MRSRRRGNPVLGFVASAFMAVVAGAAVMFLVLRFGLVPASVLSQAGLSSPEPTQAAAAVPLATATPAVPGATAAAVNPTPIVVSPSPVPTADRPRPAAADAASRYLQAWQQQRFPDMYKMLSASARQTIAEDRFLARYQAITLGAGINGLKTTLPTFTEPPTTQTRIEPTFTAQFQTARLGDFAEENKLPLVLEAGEWKVDWTPSLIFRELTPDRSVRFFPDDPVRGAVLDRNGKPLAAQGKALTVGVIPGRVKDLNLVVGELSKFLGTSPDVVRQKIGAAKPDWWVPFRDFPLDRADELNGRFSKVEGVLVEEKDQRVYPNGAVGAHVVGFTSPATAEDMKTLAAKGYEEGDAVGRAGIEKGAEEVLAGQRGGRLVIVDGSGDTMRVVAERPAKNGGNVKLSIDIDVQKRAEEALGDRVGSIVLMDPRDNNILALVSKPAYDPNGFIFGFSDEEWKKLSDDPRRPFQPRASLSTYPTGSVYKVISMAAGLERGGYKPNTMFECNGKWSVLDPKKPQGDWVPNGHGRLDLSQGLVESCDIVFYEIGHKLNQIDPNILSEFSHAFGLGEPTGIQGLQEADGIVPSPDWKKKALRQEWVPGDSVNFAIGQGFLDATPLQVANVYSTFANGGTLRTPVLIKSIVPADGSPAKEFQSQEKRRVPVSGQNIAVIRDAMKRVASGPPRNGMAGTGGTALYAFRDYRIPIAAKTGSAENQNPDAHAWFAGYGPADDPRVVVTVMVEGGKTGGTVAAPLGRQALEIILGK